MNPRRSLWILTSILVMFGFLLFSWNQGLAAPNCDFSISGYVYKGQVGDQTHPLTSVHVRVYGSNAPDFSYGSSTLIDNRTTNSSGYYNLLIEHDNYNYYFVIEENPTDLNSVGATSVQGEVITADIIRIPSPVNHYIEIKKNKFWDDRYLFSGSVYHGNVGDTNTPIADVPVSLFGAASPYPDENSTLLDSALTDASGSFQLSLSEDNYDYYFILETNLEGYTSVGATSTYGEVMTADAIQFANPLPCIEQQGDAFPEDDEVMGDPLCYVPPPCEILDGNNFWDNTGPLTYTFSGNVYEGQPGDTTTPLEGVTVNLVGSTTSDPNAGLSLGTALTDAGGAYSIELTEDSYPYYFLVETNPQGYVSVAAQSAAGSVIDADSIRFATPLEGVDLSGNDFWDELAPPSLDFSGFVYQGQVGDTSTPLEGVTVRLYGANLPYPVENPDLIDSTLTGSDGAYTLQLSLDSYSYYFIVEQNLPGLISVGAQSVDGTVVTVDQVQFMSSVASQDRTNNNFWDTLSEADFVFSGYVYLGQVFDVTQPIGGINIRLFGSTTPYPNFSGAIQIAITQTNLDGSFNIPLAADTYPYYFITEQTPFGYFSAGAWTNDGVVEDSNTIQFTAPLSGQDLSNNIFWDDIHSCLVSFTGMVYEGELNDVSTPMEGVTVSLYGSNSPNLSDATLIDSALTDEGGVYRLPIQEDDHVHEYYFLVQQNLPGYTSVGVQHYSGTTINPDVVRFTHPLIGQNISAIRFWDMAAEGDSLTLTGQVFMGEADMGEVPLSGKLVNLYGWNEDGQGPTILLDSDLTGPNGAFALTFGEDSFNRYMVVLQTETEMLAFGDLQQGAVVTGADFYIPFLFHLYFPILMTP